MSGHSILIDTNIALYLLDGDQAIAKLLDGRDVYVSFITELELLGYRGLDNEQLVLIEKLLNDCIVVNINQNIKQNTIKIRRSYKIKLPDALIAATSYYLNAPLISADSGFEKIKSLNFLKYEI